MQTISVTVAPKHFERLAANPARALAELVWNSLDADAHKIDILFDRNQLGGVEGLRVIDDGHGMTEKDAIENFGTLGSSWKQYAEKSKHEGRLLHGRNGQGRWAAYGLGDTSTWTSVAEDDGAFTRTEIVGHRDRPDEFGIDSAPASPDTKLGTTVAIIPVADGAASLAEETARDRLATAELALYLAMYPIALTVDGAKLDLAELQERRYDQDLPLPGELGEANLTIIEWRKPVERAIFLCDEDGFTASTNTRWQFWVLSTDVTTDGDRERKQRGRPFGLAYEPDDALIQVWVKTWSEVIEDAEHRMKFFQKALNVQATRDQGVDYLRQRHAEFVPEPLRNGAKIEAA